eukprot:scpid2209/ scgid28908/ 
MIPLVLDSGHSTSTRIKTQQNTMIKISSVLLVISLNRSVLSRCSTSRARMMLGHRAVQWRLSSVCATVVHVQQLRLVQYATICGGSSILLPRGSATIPPPLHTVVISTPASANRHPPAFARTLNLKTARVAVRTKSVTRPRISLSTAVAEHWWWKRMELVLPVTALIRNPVSKENALSHFLLVIMTALTTTVLLDSTAKKTRYSSDSCSATDCQDCGACRCKPCTDSIDMCNGAPGCKTELNKTADHNRTIIPSTNLTVPYNCCIAYPICDIVNYPCPTCDSCNKTVVTKNATGDARKGECCPEISCKPLDCGLKKPPPVTPPTTCNTEYNVTIHTYDACSDTQQHRCCGCFKTVTNVSSCECQSKNWTLVPDDCANGTCFQNFTYIFECNGTVQYKYEVNPECEKNCSVLNLQVCNNGCCVCKPKPICNHILIYHPDTPRYEFEQCHIYLKGQGYNASICNRAQEYGAQAGCNVSQVCPASQDMPRTPNCKYNTTMVNTTMVNTSVCCQEKWHCTNESCVVAPGVPCCTPQLPTCLTCEVPVNTTDANNCPSYKCVRKPTPPPPRCPCNNTEPQPNGQTPDRCHDKFSCGCKRVNVSLPSTCCPPGHKMTQTVVESPDNCTCQYSNYTCEPVCPYNSTCRNHTDYNEMPEVCVSDSPDCTRQLQCKPSLCPPPPPCYSPKYLETTFVSPLIPSGENCSCCNVTECVCPLNCSAVNKTCDDCNKTLVITKDECGCDEGKCVDKCSVVKCPPLSCPQADRHTAPGDCCQACKAPSCPVCPAIPASCAATTPYSTTPMPSTNLGG